MIFKTLLPCYKDLIPLQIVVNDTSSGLKVFVTNLGAP
jgi:hypothetical protein